MKIRIHFLSAVIVLSAAMPASAHPGNHSVMALGELARHWSMSPIHSGLAVGIVVAAGAVKIVSRVLHYRRAAKRQAVRSKHR